MVKQKSKGKVLVIATSRKTRGGITSVVKSHEQESVWLEYNCKWIETHIDGSNVAKIWYFCSAFVLYICLLPFYDIVHIHLSAVVRKMFFFSLAKLFRKKIITHLHIAELSNSIEGKRSNWYRFMMNHSDVVIVLSQQWKQLLKEKLNVDRNVVILYNPCPTISGDYLAKEKTILYAGSIIKRKGYNDLITAFAKIAGKFPDWRLELAGNGEIEEAKQQVELLNISSQVVFLGWINGQSKHNAFARANVFCLPSYAEGFPMAVLDAWAYGIPVVCTPVGGLPEIVIDKENALVFDCGDTNTLAQKLELIMSNSTLHASIAAKSIEFASTTFNVHNIGNQLGLIYKQLINK